MTVIVYDGATVSADRLMGAGNQRFKTPVDKLQLSSDGARVYGIAGEIFWFQAWIDWYEGRDTFCEKPQNPRLLPVRNASDIESGGVFLVFTQHGDTEYSYARPYGETIPEPDAWGSGADFAIGALDAGLNARDAAAVASARCKHCGNGLLTYNLYTMAWIAEDAHSARYEADPKTARVAGRTD